MNTPSVSLSIHTPPTYSQLIQTLVDLKYWRTSFVVEPCQFAVRGNIIDFFSPNHSHPIRIEYDDATIDRMMSFDIATQRSLSSIPKTNLVAANSPKESWFLLNEIAPHDWVSDIEINDYVVHFTYGIGQYQGLVRLTLSNGKEGEFLWIRYQNDDKVYVPLDQLHLVVKYSGTSPHPPLSNLRTDTWAKTKDKAKKETDQLAQDVYDLYVQRTTQNGFSCHEDTQDQLEFELAFPYTLTPDQAQAIAQVKADMEAPYPMDRLIVGDVGYGKTEVLLRAAFKACENGKQVAIVAPTTLLAHQHFRVLSERFYNFAYRVAVLSRFNTPLQQSKLLKELKTHQLDVVVGTHRLLQSDIHFKNLGLLIIDEEQKFGVTHKETLKHLKPHVDVLSVSATPIPRTLYMALTGARDCSQINTPPQGRKPIQTLVTPYSDDRVMSAIQTELKRGGQVYYVYNHVQHLPAKLKKLQQLLPNVRFAIAHGQMKQSQLESTMMAFLNRDYEVLICSTIIESGLDIPTVNTLVIEGVEHFGLSQLHQIRGRIGRSATQAMAYFLVTNPHALTEKSTQRLLAIKEYAALGSGYKLAMKDLEIRGAGTLLGNRQHGHVTAIGFDLYCELLNQSVAQKRGVFQKAQSPLTILPENQGFIPNTYIESDGERLAIYQRLSQMTHADQVTDLCEELTDRYGTIPQLLTSFLETIRSQLSNH